MKKFPRILIAGIGNPIRSDDGIGPYICRRIEEKKCKGVTTAIYHQLHTELAEEFLQFDVVIIADAAVEGAEVEFYRLEEKEASHPIAIGSSSHHVNATVLLSLARQLYQKELNVMICSVRGYDFELGEKFSDAGKNNADEAVSIILNWIYKQLV